MQQASHQGRPAELGEWMKHAEETAKCLTKPPFTGLIKSASIEVFSARRLREFRSSRRAYGVPSAYVAMVSRNPIQQRGGRNMTLSIRV
jgi:hypothetical protein